MDKKEENSKGLTLKALNKSSVWDLQENDIFRLWASADKDADVLENPRHYQDIIRSAFMIEEIKDDSKAVKEKYEKTGYKVAQVKLSENVKVHTVCRKHKIQFCTGPEAVLIDDREKTIREWRDQGGTGILYVSPEKTLKELEELGLL